MNNSILILVNMNSGYLTNEKLNNDIIPKFNNLNYVISFCYNLNDLDKIFNNLSNFSKIIIVGGDGSISEVIQYTINNNIEIPIGLIPTGSGNGLVNSLLNEKKIEFSLDNAISETLKFNNRDINLIKVDLFNKFNEKIETIYSFLFISYGIFSKIDVGTDYLRCFGNLRFTLGAILELILKNTFYAKLKYKDSENNWIEEEGRFIHFMANNVSHTSEFTITSPNSKSNDDLIYLSYIKEPYSRWDLFNFLNGLSDGSFTNYSNYIYTSEFIFINNDNSSYLDIDGEYYSNNNIHCTINSKNISIF